MTQINFKLSLLIFIFIMALPTLVIAQNNSMKTNSSQTLQALDDESLGKSSIVAVINYTGDIWINPPKIQLTREVAREYAHLKQLTINVQFLANKQGVIKDVQIMKSSGIQVIDQIISDAMRNATTKPYQENGENLPFKSVQPIMIDFSKCVYEDNWIC